MQNFRALAIFIRIEATGQKGKSKMMNLKSWLNARTLPRKRLLKRTIRGVTMMENHPSANCKGFDLYPLVYKFDPPREWNERRPDRSYSASVVICREGEPPHGGSARVFHVPDMQWSDLGLAKRAAVQYGENIIDGQVVGESLVGL